MAKSAEPKAKPPGKRALARIARVESIISSAMTIIEKEGIETLTIHRLAKDMNWAVGAMYRYFPSKDALFVELQCRVIDEFSQLLNDGLVELDNFNTRRKAEKKTRALSVPFAVSRLYQEFARKQPAHFRLISLTIGDPAPRLDDEFGSRVIAELMPVLVRVAKGFNEATGLKALSTGNDLKRTVTFWSAIHAIVPLAKFGRFDAKLFDADALMEEVVFTLLKGWSAPESHLVDAQASTKRWAAARKRKR
jgi:AcrR family transcriptional regulator